MEKTPKDSLTHEARVQESSTRETLSEEVLTEEVFHRAVTEASRQVSAITAELEMVRDSWYEIIVSEHPEAKEPQLKALLALKLQEVGELIPPRRVAEKQFKEDHALMKRTLGNLSAIMGTLEAKAEDDSSARIEFFQAQRLLRDIESTRMPNLETIYQEASRRWFKPFTDPLSLNFSCMINEVANLAARLEYEETIRVPIKNAKITTVTQESARPMVQETKTMMQFDIAKYIRRFAGDLSESDVLMKFSNWKSSWFNLLKEMETLRGFNQIALFQKLKDCLEGPALELVSKYSGESRNSYDAAMLDLMDRFQDPVSLAGSYIISGIAPRESSAERAIAIDHSFDALYNMRDVFERENVDMNAFALMLTFLTAMPPEDRAKWNGYKARKKQEYKLRFEEAAKTGDPLPEWKAGMVECREQFQAWLKLLSTEFRKSTSSTMDERETTATNFVLQTSRERSNVSKCFICPQQGANHPTARCPTALGMSSQEWFNTCRSQSKCAKCTYPYDKKHRCTIKCRICHGQGNRSDHFIVMCPANKNRTASLGLRSDKGGEEKRFTKGSKRHHEDKKEETHLAKWAKGIDMKIQSIADLVIKNNSQVKSNAKGHGKGRKPNESEK